MKEYIKQLKAEKKYRPTASVILFNKSGKVLLVKSAKDPTAWYFPQGGIKDNERLPHAIKRELKEELGVDYNEYKVINPGLHQDKLDINFSPGRGRGYTSGKAYFFVSAKYLGDGNFKLKNDEVSDYRWVSIEECNKLFSVGERQKSLILKNTLNKLAW